MQGVTVTPSGEADVILSQFVCSKMHLPSDVAMVGLDRSYWQFKTFCEFYGLIDKPWAIMVLGILKDRAVAASMSHSTILHRASSCMTDDSLDYIEVDEHQGPAEARLGEPQGPAGLSEVN